MTGHERTSEDAKNRERGWIGRRGEISRWEDGDGYPTDIYGEPIFSFDYSTRVNAPQLSGRLHLTIGHGLKFWKRKKAQRKSEKPGDHSLKNITPFSKTTIFIAASEIDALTAGLHGFFETFGYANRPRFVIAFCEMACRGGCRERGMRGRVV